ncbi:MAG: nucleoside/nucleotide kinase family protein, partial [Nocardioides sp.]|nr:nucleoside/nucleotide kinase family protein [Nocardioides sp.]
MLGITGAPGAGKSTLAALLAARHGATVVPMDGFHLADVELSLRGLRERKGAPETFDA